MMHLALASGDDQAKKLISFSVISIEKYKKCLKYLLLVCLNKRITDLAKL
jgi:hypothetical protein